MRKNIVLIGMPGCGKTTIGKILSKRLECKFIDIDEYIEETNGKSIPQIFKLGEDYFRILEMEAIDKLRKEKNLVISTGGGVVKNYINIKRLKENGAIIFIDRCIENIAEDVNISNRPILKSGINKLHELFQERYEYYKNYSDFHVINDGSVEEVVERTIDMISRRY